MAKKKMITQPSKNKSTEQRRAHRVKQLMIAGFSMDYIREEMNLSLAMLDYYFEIAIRLQEYKKYRQKHDRKFYHFRS